jgi:hypothetical protein
MYSKLVILVLFFVCSYCSCKNNERPPIIKNYLEEDKADSINYFKDFDLYSFKGINKLSPDSLSFPFVKMIYRNDSLILKAHYDSKRTNAITFYKLQNKWCSHSWHFYEGDQQHTFLINLDTALLELTYSRNPFDTLSTYPALLNKVRVRQVFNDTIFDKYCIHFFSDNISFIPDLNKFDIERYKKICNEIIYSKEYAVKDSIRSGYYIGYETSNDKKVLDRDWTWNNRPLMYGSIFYTDFESMKDGNTNLSLSEKLENLKKAFDIHD